MTALTSNLLALLLVATSTLAAAQPASPADHFDLSHWKLTLPVGAAGTASGHPLEISASQLCAGYNDPQYFHAGTNGEMVFWSPVTGARTKNTEYPRTELREVIIPADDDVCWAAPGTHVLDVRSRVSAVPSSQKVIIGQIHSFSGKAKPLVKLQFFKNRIEALVKESPTNGEDLKLTFPQVGLDQDFNYQIKLQDGLLSVTGNDTVQTANVFKSAPEWANQTFYFKVGAYVQDNKGLATEGARVAISKLQVSHRGSEAKRDARPHRRRPQQSFSWHARSRGGRATVEILPGEHVQPAGREGGPVQRMTKGPSRARRCGHHCLHRRHLSAQPPAQCRAASRGVG